jgi:hypothetical protein
MVNGAKGKRRFAAGAITLCLLSSMTTGCAAVVAAVASKDSAAAQRAQYVETMLSNSYTSGPESEKGVMSIITGYGGGYVTDAQLSQAPGPAEKLTMNVVIGAGRVINSMQGETDLDPAVPACFTFTVGYYSYSGTKKEVPCPASLTTASAQAMARQQTANQVNSEHYVGSPAAIPQTSGDAEKASGLIPVPGQNQTAPALTAADFAAGTDAIQGKPDAALAVPQAGGGCVFITYRRLQSAWIAGGKAGTANTQVADAWAAPTDAPCTGFAALAASAFLTVDTYAGG